MGSIFHKLCVSQYFTQLNILFCLGFILSMHFKDGKVWSRICQKEKHL